MAGDPWSSSLQYSTKGHIPSASREIFHEVDDSVGGRCIVQTGLTPSQSTCSIPQFAPFNVSGECE